MVTVARCWGDERGRRPRSTWTRRARSVRSELALRRAHGPVYDGAGRGTANPAASDRGGTRSPDHRRQDCHDNDLGGGVSGELAKLSAGVYRRASGRTGCETFKFTQNYPCIARYQKRRHPPRAIKPWNLALEARGPGRKTADSVNGGQSMPDLCENTQPISPQDFQNAVFGPTTLFHRDG